MPRSSETPEAKILAYFETTPIQVAQMVFGLAAAIVKRRAHVPTKKTAKERTVIVGDQPGPADN